MNTKLVSVLSLLLVLASQTALSAQKNALNISESEIIDIINGKIEKVQANSIKPLSNKKVM